MNIFNPIKANIYYSNQIINSIIINNKKRKRLNPSKYIQDKELYKVLEGAFVVIDDGRLKQVNFSQKPLNNLDLILYNLLDEEVTLKKLTNFDKRNRNVRYNFMIESNYISQYHKALFINLKWWQYWQIKIDKKDTYLHRIKLLDKIVFTVIGVLIGLFFKYILELIK